jgi:DnaK suppressor protein
MKSEEKLELESIIRQEIVKTKEKIEELLDLCQPIAPENAIGRISRMDAINNKAINEAALVKANEKMRLLKLALENNHESGYGLCKACGNNIQPKRMALMPQSLFCVQCAQKR